MFDFDHPWSLEKALSEKELHQKLLVLLKHPKSTKTSSQKCWRNIIWVDFFGSPCHPNGIKTCLGSPLMTSEKWEIPIWREYYNEFGIYHSFHVSLLKTRQKNLSNSETYLEPYQKSKMECFPKKSYWLFSLNNPY